MSGRLAQGLASDMNHQEIRLLEENCQLIELIGKKIKDQTSIKVGIVQPIDIDELPVSCGITRVKVANQVKICNQSSGQRQPDDQLYLPWLDSSESESVEESKFHNLRERFLKTITPQEFYRTLRFYKTIEIIDDSDQQDKIKQKKQYVKINFKEEAGKRTKQTKIEYLLKNRGVAWPKRKKIRGFKMQRINKQRN